MVTEVGLESVDEEIDCLKFKLREGDIMQFVEILQLFDEKLLEE